MGLENLLSISGKSGLFRLVGQMKNGIIVESLEDGKRFPVHGSAKVSALEEISIYTEEEEIPLKDVFDRIYEKMNGEKAMSHKDDKNKIKALFEEVVPEYDAERVYVSDMVKVVKWYNELIEFTDYDPNAEPEESDDKADEAEDVTDAAPAQEAEPSEEAEEKPKKKKASKPKKDEE